MSGKSAILIGFYDSDWSGLEEDMKSTSGYAFSFGSGVFSWASMKQSSVSLSTAEVEYVNAAEATTQAIWLRFVLSDFGEEQLETTPIMCDNTSTIAMSKNLVFHQRSKTHRKKVPFHQRCNSRMSGYDLLQRSRSSCRYLHEGIAKGKVLLSERVTRCEIGKPFRREC